MKKISAILVVLALVMSLGSGAFASTVQETDVPFSVEAGEFSLYVPEVNSFGEITLDAQPKQYYTTFSESWKVVDARGTQEGWRVQAIAQQFAVVEPTSGFAEGTEAHSLPEGSLLFYGPNSLDRVGTGTSELPSNLVSDPVILDNGSTLTVLRANEGEGMGEFDIGFDANAFELTLDPTTALVDQTNYPDMGTPYQTTVTWTLVSGP